MVANSIAVNFIDSTSAIEILLDALFDPELTPSKSLAVDLEGIELGRTGKACIMQLFPRDAATVYIVDLTVLGHDAFDTSNNDGRSLRQVLENDEFQKIFWDVRNDSDALHHHFRVSLTGCVDLQVLELCVRHSRLESTRLVHGLARSMTSYSVGSTQWKKAKEAGTAMFAPEKGGSYDVFVNRPMPRILIQYCAQDVIMLFDLETSMRGRIQGGFSGLERILVRETASRIELSKSPHFNGKGRHMALANISWR